MRLTTAAPSAVAWSAVPLISGGHPPTTFAIAAWRLYRILAVMGAGEKLSISIEEESVTVVHKYTRFRFHNNPEAQAKLRRCVPAQPSAKSD